MSNEPSSCVDEAEYASLPSFEAGTSSEGASLATLPCATSACGCGLGLGMSIGLACVSMPSSNKSLVTAQSRHVVAARKGGGVGGPSLEDVVEELVVEAPLMLRSIITDADAAAWAIVKKKATKVGWG